MPEEFNLPKTEEKILKFWDEKRIFEKTLAAREDKKKFVFYEGPPYANGKPGIHHVLARVVKDVILRYKTMRGYYVPRKAGWDTHGLPVEMAAEKSLGLKSKKDIEKFGVKLFNEKAKEQVWIYKDEWEGLTRRIGYWLDLKNAYVTYEADYIETLWWTMAQIAKRKLLYKGFKVVPWCTRCGTALSSHELALGYKETEDNSVYVKFRLRRGQDVGGYFMSDENSYILSWTTTLWTLPGNVALAVGANIKYAILKKMVNGVIERWIVAEDIVKKEGNPIGSPADIRDIMAGDELVGLRYEPLFDMTRTFADGMLTYADKIYKVYAADFVATDEGTGVVHTAVMYGEDDYQLGIKVGLPQRHTVGEDGKFKAEVPGLAGLYVKDSKTENLIIEKLKIKKLLFKVERFKHDYPYCWRCETPLLYYTRTSWFIAMSKLRGKLLTNNKTINWIPEHLRDGRFGEWLKEGKDWNLSRERYWGTPLPIWECKKCGSYKVIGSLDELSRRAGGTRNSYWVMRHGEAKSNLEHFIDDGRQRKNTLTVIGGSLAEKSAEDFGKRLAARGKKIDIIFSSDIERAKETAAIAAKILGVKKIIFDKRLREIELGPALEGCHDAKYHELYPTHESKFERRPESGESLRDLRARAWGFLLETEKKYRGKNILLVSHEYPIWMLTHAAAGWDEARAIKEKIGLGDDFIGTSETRELIFKTVPRDDTGLVDLHRPYADEIKIICGKCGAKINRVKEIADVWYDSGAMPYAQAYWPFGQSDKRPRAASQRGRKAISDKVLRELDYPADYIAEGVDQTRGWFYTLLAIATALGYEAPYKNVISLGLINDKFGQKMSKSKGNTVNPWDIINKYGVDAVRWYFYTANPPGEAKNFDEAEISKTYRRMHLILWNSFVFYKTYARNEFPISNFQFSKVKHVLDKWIIARLDETIAAVTKNLDKYEIRGAALLIESFVNDLSRWYIRRSRRRLQRPRSRADFAAASGTLGYVLSQIAKLLAPFTPFFSELLFGQLRGTTQNERGTARKITRNYAANKESVHLEDWPKIKQATSDSPRLSHGEAGKRQATRLIADMAEARRLAALALAKRAQAGIKIRQPLTILRIAKGKSQIANNKELLAVLAEEVNVKKIIFDAKIKEEVELDTNVTPELKEEGILRELIRAVQDLRQKAGLKPKDKIMLMVQLPAEIRLATYKHEMILKSEVGAENIEYKKSEKFEAEAATKINNVSVWLAARKI